MGVTFVYGGSRRQPATSVQYVTSDCDDDRRLMFPDAHAAPGTGGQP